MNNDNSYETAEVIELGKAQEIILGPRNSSKRTMAHVIRPSFFLVSSQSLTIKK